MGAIGNVQEFVRLSREIDDHDALHNLVTDVTGEYDLKYFLLAHHVNITSPHYVQLSNYPEEWGNRMRRKTQFAADPVMRACQKTSAPFMWE